MPTSLKLIVSMSKSRSARMCISRCAISNSAWFRRRTRRPMEINSRWCKELLRTTARAVHRWTTKLSCSSNSSSSLPCSSSSRCSRCSNSNRCPFSKRSKSRPNRSLHLPTMLLKMAQALARLPSQAKLTLLWTEMKSSESTNSRSSFLTSSLIL